MNINGTNVFMGVYSERMLHNNKILDDKVVSSQVTQKINEVVHTNYANKISSNVSISSEAMKLLCSEEGYQKMKQECGDIFVINAKQNQRVAEGKNPDDPFWSTTGDQWLQFSEMLYSKGFFDNMNDQEVKDFEDILSDITFGMDMASRSQYRTSAIQIKPNTEKWNYFMTSAELDMELESSVATLKVFSDKMIPDEYREDFNKLIDKYYQHNEEVISEYQNPMENFNRTIARYYEKGTIKIAENPTGSYLFDIQLGKIKKSKEEEEAFREKIAKRLENIKENQEITNVLDYIKKDYSIYVTGNSDDEKFSKYVIGNSQYLFNHMENIWSQLTTM